MKKKYISLEMEVVILLAGDILTFSDEDDFVPDPGYNPEDWGY